MAITPEVKKIANNRAKRKYVIAAGNSILDSFIDEAQARRALEADRETYLYWANSASTSIENAKPIVVRL